MKKNKKEIIKEIKEIIIGIAAFLLVSVILVGIVAGVIQDWKHDANDKYEYSGEGIKFTEARCIVGSIFYKDSIVLSPDDVEIDKLSLFGEKKTVYPYHTIREITFSKSLNGFKVVINFPGSFFGTDSITLYFNQKDTFNLLEDDLKDYSKNRCIITESL